MGWSLMICFGEGRMTDLVCKRHVEGMPVYVHWKVRLDFPNAVTPVKSLRSSGIDCVVPFHYFGVICLYYSWY